MQYKEPKQLTLYYRAPVVSAEVTATKLPFEANAFLLSFLQFSNLIQRVPYLRSLHPLSLTADLLAILFGELMGNFYNKKGISIIQRRDTWKIYCSFLQYLRE